MCPSVALFGVWCPGCGGLRGVYDLGHGDLGAAASSNLLLVLAVPVVLVLLALWGRAAWTGRPLRLPRPASSTPVLAALGVAVLAFTVLRNLPAGAWLAP